VGIDAGGTGERCMGVAFSLIGFTAGPDPKNPLNDLSSMNKVVEYMAMGCALVSFDLHEARVTAQDAAVYALRTTRRSSQS
jgi:hypothetical protein